MSNIKHIGNSTFKDWGHANSDKSLEVPRSVNTIGTESFRGWESYTGGVTFGEVYDRYQLPDSMVRLSTGKYTGQKLIDIDYTKFNTPLIVGDILYIAEWDDNDNTGVCVIGEVIEISSTSVTFEPIGEHSSGSYRHSRDILGIGISVRRSGYIVNSNITIGGNAFRDWKSALLPGVVTLPSQSKYNRSVFEGWESTRFGFSSNIDGEIDYFAFSRWNSVICIPNDVTGCGGLFVSTRDDIGAAAFSGWSNFMYGLTINIWASHRIDIGAYAFYGWENARAAAEFVYYTRDDSVKDQNGRYYNSYSRSSSGWSLYTNNFKRTDNSRYVMGGFAYKGRIFGLFFDSSSSPLRVVFKGLEGEKVWGAMGYISEEGVIDTLAKAFVSDGWDYYYARREVIKQLRRAVTPEKYIAYSLNTDYSGTGAYYYNQLTTDDRSLRNNEAKYKGYRIQRWWYSDSKYEGGFGISFGMEAHEHLQEDNWVSLLWMQDGDYRGDMNKGVKPWDWDSSEYYEYGNDSIDGYLPPDRASNYSYTDPTTFTDAIGAYSYEPLMLKYAVNIGSYAFYGWRKYRGLPVFAVPTDDYYHDDSVRVIGDYAFYGWSLAKGSSSCEPGSVIEESRYLRFPKSIIYIGNHAFDDGFPYLHVIHFDHYKSTDGIPHIGDYALRFDGQPVYLTIPDTDSLGAWRTELGNTHPNVTVVTKTQWERGEGIVYH